MHTVIVLYIEQHAHAMTACKLSPIFQGKDHQDGTPIQT